VKLTLGRWVPPEDRKGGTSPEVKVGDAMSLGHARKLAADARIKVSEGRDPAGEKRDAKEGQRAAEANTVQAVSEEYLRRKCGMKVDAEGNFTFDARQMRSGPGRYATLKRLIFPKLGDRPIGEIKKSDVVRLLDQIEDASGPVMADRALALIRTIMNWHATRDDDYRSPIIRGMARTKPKERARKRILADDEIREIWAALDTAPDLPVCYPRYVRSILLTAARRNEASGMHSTEFEGDNWTIPGNRYKTKVDHVIPLTAVVKALIGEKPEGVDGNSWFVFSTTSGEKPFSGFSKAKKALDTEITKRRKAGNRPAMSRWTLHDLRRTSRTLMSRAKVASEHAERVLGHVIGGVEGIYDRHEYLDEKRAALEALAATVESILRPLADNVVQFPLAAGEGG
jgi:integrase